MPTINVATSTPKVIVGGLVMSQLLTLYTTPVVYVYLDRWRSWLSERSGWRLAVGG